MSKGKIVMFCALAAAALTIMLFSNASEKNTSLAERYCKDYIIDGNKKIPLSLTTLSDRAGEMDSAAYQEHLAAGLVNDHTLGYFRFLQTRVGNDADNVEGHLEAVKAHLEEQFPENREQATALYELYEKYTRYEMKMAGTSLKANMPENAGATLSLIEDLQKEQREHFGTETADALFGPDLKVAEYTARRQGILNDRSSDGAEKERMLHKLDADFWGDEAVKILARKSVHERFEEKLVLYDRELAALDPQARGVRIEEIRQEFFTPQVVAELEKEKIRRAQMSARALATAKQRQE